MNVKIEKINERLQELVATSQSGSIKDAVLYSLLAPGKRLRPLLFLTLLESYGLASDDYLDIACAIEMIHTYSLIHDDLPGMDNDSLRRGRPTCHIQFDEASAILAGDALLNLSISTLLTCDMDALLKVEVATRLFESSGINGMIFGQQQDIYFENKQANLEELNTIHLNKTGALISVCLEMAALIANPKQALSMRKIGYDLGLAFQIQDDILDVIGDQDLLGKVVGSDETNQKSTYVTLLGLEESQKKVNELFNQCVEDTKKLLRHPDTLLELFDKILKRVS